MVTLVTVDFKSAHPAMDYEAQHDAETCRLAVRKHFPHLDAVIVVRKVKNACYDVALTRVSKSHDEVQEAVEVMFFAQGFMASAHLWER
jgi:hypothetical protein